MTTKEQFEKRIKLLKEKEEKLNLEKSIVLHILMSHPNHFMTLNFLSKKTTFKPVKVARLIYALKKDNYNIETKIIIKPHKIQSKIFGVDMTKTIRYYALVTK